MYTGGVDYEAGPYYVNITEGDMSAEFCINITDDNELEEKDETFNLTINTDLLHPDIVIINPNKSMVIILDDEST